MNRQTNTNVQYNESVSMEEKIAITRKRIQEYDESVLMEERIAITRKRIQEEVKRCGHLVPVIFIDNGHEFAETKAGD